MTAGSSFMIKNPIIDVMDDDIPIMFQACWCLDGNEVEGAIGTRIGVLEDGWEIPDMEVSRRGHHRTIDGIMTGEKNCEWEVSPISTATKSRCSIEPCTTYVLDLRLPSKKPMRSLKQAWTTGPSPSQLSQSSM